MLFYYIRHGEPIYNPDSLTPEGHRQAEALSKRLAIHGLDRVYSSTSNRAMQTAEPTCRLVKKEPILLDFANEKYAWREMTVETDSADGRTWLFYDWDTRALFNTPEIREMSDRWFEHPAFEKYNFGKAIDRISKETDGLLASLGYQHIPHTGKYKVIQDNDQRVALFAHGGFGLAFLSCLLDIPYPMFCTHFDISFTGLTVIEFAEEGGYSIPKVLTHSSDAHLYKEELSTLYNHKLLF